MSINVLSAGYYFTGYTNNNSTKTETGSSFADIVNQKSAEAKIGQEKTPAVLDLVGENAPDKVKQAWMEASKDMGGWFTVGGSWVSADGKHSHMTQMGVQIGLKWLNGELDQADLLGNSVGSAISVVEKWIYDLDHPLAGQPARSAAEQQEVKKERAFYEAFLDELKNLSDPASKDTQNISNYAGNANIVSPISVEADEEAVQEEFSTVIDSIGPQAPDAVKQAWKEAEAETGGFFGVGGFWISNDGKECQITKMFVDRFVRWYKGEADPDDLLGNSVESAMRAVEKWIYDLDHPLAGQPARSIEQQRLTEMERAFYETFIEKLRQLS